MTTDRSEVLSTSTTSILSRAPRTRTSPSTTSRRGITSQGDEVFKHHADQWLAIALKDGTYEGFAEPWVGDVELSLEWTGAKGDPVLKVAALVDVRGGDALQVLECGSRQPVTSSRRPSTSSDGEHRLQGARWCRARSGGRSHPRLLPGLRAVAGSAGALYDEADAVADLHQRRVAEETARVVAT